MKFLNTSIVLVMVFFINFLNLQSQDSTKMRLMPNGYVMISVENGHARQGWTPIFLHFQDLSISLWLDSEGDVWLKTNTDRYEKSLFHLDYASGSVSVDNLYSQPQSMNSSRFRLSLHFSERFPIQVRLDLDNDRVLLGTGGKKDYTIGYISEEVNEGKRHIRFFASSVRKRADFVLIKRAGKVVVSREDSRIKVKEAVR